MFGSLLKAAAVVIDAPVAVVRDVVTLGGEVAGEPPKGACHTSDALGRFVENVKDAADPDK